MKSASAVREQAVATVSNRRAAADAIRKVVIQSTGFCTEAIIEKSRFEQQYLDLEKTALNAREKELLRPLFERTDSTARKEVEAIKKKFSAQLDSLIALEDNRKKQYNRNMTSRLESLLVTDLDSVNAAYFHYQLAELYYADENSSYLRNYEKFDKDRMVYEQKLTAYRDGRILEPPVEPIAPIIDHLASGAEFTTALALSPPPEIAAAAHYGLAWCYNDAGATDSALQQMRTVASGFPASKFAAQAWMYIGEYLFDKNDLPAAIQCYQSVMKYPESEWFEEALYKLAWSQYRLSNPEKAISSFLALVSLGSGTGDKTKMLLEKESMDYIAISFSESDLTGPRGLDRAAAFAKKLGDPDRGSQILHRLASVYSDQGRYDMARHTYTTLLKMNPSYRNIVGVESELMAIKDRDASPEEISRLKVEFFKSYNSKSTWAKNQTDPENIVKADNLAEGQLYEAAIGYHQLALQKNDAAVYATALSTYSDYIRHYPSSRRASECHYNLAELEFSLGDYQKAAEDYLAVSKRYPDSKFRETAAWNAIVASQNLVKKEVSAQ
jgi:TolA-binding protein